MPRGKTFANAAEAIGDTPMITINELVPSEHATVFAKCEFFQPLNSVKDRIIQRTMPDASNFATNKIPASRRSFCLAFVEVH